MAEKNYITPSGFQALQDELQFLLKKERPEVTETVAWAASNGDRSENADYIYGKKRLREIDKRIQFLTKRIDVAEVVNPEEIQAETVKFGATVSVLLEDNQDATQFKIVGVDEVDVDCGKVSWKSPIGKALLNHRAGDFVSYSTPKGEMSLEIIKILYEKID